MLSIFKKNKTPKRSSLIRSTSGISCGDDTDASPTLVTAPRKRARKSHKTSRGSTTGRFDSAIMFISLSNMSSSNPASDSLRPASGIADLVLHPHLYTALLLQTSVDYDSNERPTGTDPGTGMRSMETSLGIPNFTPHDSISMDTPSIFVNGIEVNTLLEGITYDAILSSTLHKNLGIMEGMKYGNIPATRTPPNSPTAIQEGGFGSLMSVSMAIMEGRV